MQPVRPAFALAAGMVLAAVTAGCGSGSDMAIGQDAGPRDAAVMLPPVDLAGADLWQPPQPDLQQCPPDRDGDGVARCDGDCDDEDRAVHPGAADVCDGRDNDCDGRIDEGFDEDGDGWTTCAGDCDDTSPTIHPAALARCNGRDNNCNGPVDDAEDGDGDGYSTCADCDDTLAAVNRDAVEVQGDQIDNDCNGQTDEAPATCDQALAFGSTDARDYARAIELCPGPFLVDAQFPVLADARARAIATGFGLYPTKAGRNAILLSSGVAAAPGQPGYVAPQNGTDFGRTSVNPLPGCGNCGTIGLMVRDVSEFQVTLRVPSNARSFSFDFNFMSAEYPEWVNRGFNDKFLVVLESRSYAGNVSFDATGRPIEINNAFFTITRAQDLAGTGYDAFDPSVLGPAGGGTGWLTTTAPVTPGEVIKLRFLVMDEGDGILDSTAIVDRFRWSLQPAQGGPSTVRTM